MDLKEDDLKIPIAKEMKKRNYEVFFEVPFKGKIPDIVCISKNNDIIGIELKLKKWKSALRQASFHPFWATKSYVAFPIQTSKLVLKNKRYFEEEGIGIIIIDLVKEIIDFVIEAKTSKLCTERWKFKLIQNAYNKGHKYG